MTIIIVIITKEIWMKKRLICAVGMMALCVSPILGGVGMAQTSNTATGAAANNGAPASLPPLDQLVTATCRQAWHMGGKTQDGFFAIVEQLTALSAKNRGVALPDNQAAGE